MMKFKSLAALFFAVISTTAFRIPASAETPIYKRQITPHWCESESSFWYQNDLDGGDKEFIFVDAVAGKRRLAFDHRQLSDALKRHAVDDASATRLSIHELAIDDAGEVAEFRTAGRLWRYQIEANRLEIIQKRSLATGPTLDANRIASPHRSWKHGSETSLVFENQTDGTVRLFWINAEGNRSPYGELAPGQSHEQHTFSGHIWEVLSADDSTICVFEARETPSVAAINRNGTKQPDRPKRRQQVPVAPERSPDNDWRVEIEAFNLTVHHRTDGRVVRLTTDGNANSRYERYEWSPDAQALVAIRVEPQAALPVYRVESSPKAGGRAILHQSGYPLPGDPFNKYHLQLFNMVTVEQVPCTLDPIGFGEFQLRWEPTGHRFSFQQVDRGHQRFRFIEVDAASGEVHNVIDERSDTFIWTEHREPAEFDIVHRLEKSRQLIYASERSGWRHLYLVDCDEPGNLNPITSGSWVVRDIDKIDEGQQQIWFQASGIDHDQDPYLLHACRINFDGSGFTRLTEANGNHSLQYSPNRRWLIDTYSRVDLPPVHELRRISDGQFLCLLESADANAWRDAHPYPPQVFSAKGRDRETDIWGVIYRPQSFDPNRKYPVIEDIYAGPHGSFVPKSFSASDRYDALLELGFIIVKIDGMGTANRSKAFHDVCWHNLKDAGFLDRIAWMQAAAKQHPAIDLSRVGIFGTSAGGQSAAVAVIHHPEFYHAAVASCGCHDNRMDKASWNEQWMGYPIGPHYAENSNIDNAKQLNGKLMLIVGELDSNVPPESTYRFVDALVKANKDFEFLMIPGMGHSDGGDYGQRRMREFFVRQLKP